MTNYRYEQINNHCYRIIDAFHVAMYLVIGEQYAALLDTGYGLQGLKAYVEQFTDKPIIVLLSHGHLDHAFGIYEFDNIFMNPRDLPVYNAHNNIEYRQAFLLRETHQNDFSQLQETRTIQFEAIDENDSIDLGGITIQVFSVPGHTPGSLMFLVREDRMILFGDAAGPGTLLTEDFSTNISQYLIGLLRVKEIENRYDLILRNHGSFTSKKELLDNVIAAARDILTKRDAKELLPDWFHQMFPDQNKNHYEMFAARERSKENGSNRADGKEGNILYRRDKVR